ncbi:type II toxin-antitoxin system Phd/YefM family antitoxin [Fructilactobacillus frigidiflavus]|uniref:type II toxin-antitoxin system Phd/YefM family antitoxin n=1 Tax=Fructilactobacillus frigidiflavus TaxID=3242688 RepID=UPI0037569E23
MIVTPSEARKNLFKITEKVNRDHDVVNVSSSKNDNDAVIMSKQDYDSLITTIHLIQGGLLDDIKDAKKEGYVEITNGIDWDKI